MTSDTFRRGPHIILSPRKPRNFSTNRLFNQINAINLITHPQTKNAPSNGSISLDSTSVLEW